MKHSKKWITEVTLVVGLTCAAVTAQAQVFEVQRSGARAVPEARAAVPTPVKPELPAATTASSMESLDGERKLMIADVLSFQILEDGEPAKRMIVTDSAEVDVPYVGRVKAEGRTCKDLATEVKRLLEKDFYHKATVIIGLDYNAYGSRTPSGRGSNGNGGHRIASTSAEDGYTMMGQVAHPGVFPLRPGLEFKLSHAILQSGGFQKFANNRRVRVLRKEPTSGQLHTLIVNLRDVMDKGRLEKDILLQKGDVIIVDKKLLNF